MTCADESTSLAVPCAQGQLHITALAAGAIGASLDRGQPRGSALADLRVLQK